MSPDIAQCLLGRGQVTPIENHCPRWLEVLLCAYYGASLMAHLVKNLPAMGEAWIGEIPWRREQLPTPVFWPGESHLKTVAVVEEVAT